MNKIIAYIEGNIRYKLYYSKLSWLIPKHVKEQYKFRLKIMDKICYTNGECKLCGCQTTALQMASKECDKPCYPGMMDRKTWKMFKAGSLVYVDNSIWRLDISTKTIVKKNAGEDPIATETDVYKLISIVGTKFKAIKSLWVDGKQRENFWEQ